MDPNDGSIFVKQPSCYLGGGGWLWLVVFADGDDGHGLASDRLMTRALLVGFFLVVASALIGEAVTFWA